MSSLRSRLGKLAPGLTAKERFILLLRTHNAGEPQDPEIRRTMPKSEIRAFNRYAHLAYVANVTVGPLLFAISVHAEGIEYASQRITMIEAAASQLEEAYPEGFEAHEGMVTVPDFLRGLAKELRKDMWSDLSLRWRELRAVEIVWDEIAGEFDGEPIVDEKMRRLRDETRDKLMQLSGVFSANGQKKRLPEPAAAFVDQLRDAVKQAYIHMGWIEPEAEQKGRSYGRQARPASR